MYTSNRESVNPDNVQRMACMMYPCYELYLYERRPFEQTLFMPCLHRGQVLPQLKDVGGKVTLTASKVVERK